MRRPSSIETTISRQLAKKAMPIALSVVAVGVCMTIYLSSWISSEDRKADEAVQRNVAYLSAIADLMSHIQDAEIGQRGFLLTGDELYLKPYTTAMDSLDGMLDNLAEGAENASIETGSVATLRSLIAQKKSELEQSVEYRRAGNENASIALVKTGQGKILMDGIRSVLAQMEKDGLAQLAKRSEAASAAKARMHILLLLFAIMVGGMALLVVRATVTRAKAAERTRDELLSHADRRLMAVMAADLVGYSRLMEKNEADTLERLKAARDVIDTIIEENNGAIITTAGDSIVAAFPSALSAIDCALQVQNFMVTRNADRPEDDRLLFRIGMNVGDVIIDNGDIFGDTVNIAARLEGIAEPGGICVSRSVRDHIRKQRKLKFEDAGFQQVKNISRPISTFRVRVAA
ncbi:CHASE3 domain-containing protein [Agrobacterium larrymoorei]|uniref:Class 3 adenylate cyclase n=1 Tax=Agrobacterium larrymoorei TaxID=160699 RepID=A0ABU0UHP8_9HYPH|nr:CHASE3 domain-containing protein [Agrobacterium larrymoorei]MDQ1184454.1 class 3 adenylate cyclase [Agrobacterium larrymoorei]